MSALVVTLFFGGFTVPFLTAGGFAFSGGVTWRSARSAWRCCRC